jgi:hypothetical protein
MASLEGEDADEDSCSSFATESSDTSDFDSEYDGLVDDLKYLRTSETTSDESDIEVEISSEHHKNDAGFTTIETGNHTPISVFKRFFTEEIIKLITDQTNLYRKQKKRNSQSNENQWKEVTEKEIESFLGIVIVMSINSLPELKHYWKVDGVLHNTFISSIMSRDRFLQIFSALHLAENIPEAQGDPRRNRKLYKIENFVQILLRNFQSNYKLGRYCSVDETMVKFNPLSPEFF